MDLVDLFLDSAFTESFADNPLNIDATEASAGKWEDILINW